MLVLSRKQSEQIEIGEDIVITVCKIVGDKVRIGIDAPRHIRITRPDARAQSQPEPEVAR